MSFFKKLFSKPQQENHPQMQVAEPENVVNEIRAASSEQNANEESVRVLPRIKVDYSHEIYKNDESRSFKGNPMPGGIELPEDQKPIVKNLYEDLLLCFAIDKETHYELMQKHVLAKNPDLNEDLLHQVSINAMVKEIGENIKMNGDPNHIVMVTAGGNFEAAIILLEGFWEQMYPVFGGNVVVAIPARDLLFICKEENQEAIDKLKGMVKEYFDNPETQGLLSKALYKKEQGKEGLKIFDTAF